MTARDFSAFQMTDPHRNRMLEENSFFYEQAMKRIMTQFSEDDMEKEADAFAKAAYEKMSRRFNPDIHDESSFAEDAYFAGTELYQMLVEMRDDVRLGLVATMFHNWDKELRDWLGHEVRHWNSSEHLKRAIWEASIDDIFNLFKDLGFDVRAQHFFGDLDACRLIVNVFKHGDGKSLDDLAKRYPKFAENATSSMFAANLNMRLIQYQHVEISDSDFKKFSEAINNFWVGVPMNIMGSEISKVPKWFRDALNEARKVG